MKIDQRTIDYAKERESKRCIGSGRYAVQCRRIVKPKHSAVYLLCYQHDTEEQRKIAAIIAKSDVNIL